MPTRRYRGASHMPIITYENKLCVVLFGDCDPDLDFDSQSQNKFQVFMDSGGHAESGENPLMTASREGKEESLNTFSVDVDKLHIKWEQSDHIDFIQPTESTQTTESTQQTESTQTIETKLIHNYVVYRDYYAFFLRYNLKFEEIEQMYYHNARIIFSSEDAPPHWKESCSVTIFTIESLNIEKMLDRDYFDVFDVFGNKKIVHRRPIKYIKYAIEQGIFQFKNDEWTTSMPITDYTVRTYEALNFLDGTNTIKV